MVPELCISSGMVAVDTKIDPPGGIDAIESLFDIMKSTLRFRATK